MFLEESLWIFENIKKLETGKKIIDFGSGDFDYRVKKQPYIENMYKRVQNELGLEITSVDIQDSEGVDVVCDITEENTFSEEKKNGYGVVLACNILEHVVYKRFEIVLKNIYEVLEQGGYCIVTVPYNIGIHLSPIDNGFRPTCEELTSLMKLLFEKVVVEEIECSHYREPYLSHPELLPKPVVTCGVFRKRR